MKTAKFFLILLVVIVLVLILASALVKGLGWGGGQTVDNTEERSFTTQDQEEILSSLQAAPVKQYTLEEQKEILESLTNAKK